MECFKKKDRVCLYKAQAAAPEIKASFDFNLHAAIRLHYLGTTGRTLSMDEYMVVARKANSELWDLVKGNKISSPIDKVYPIDSAEESLARMNSDSHVGKIILKI